MSAFHSDLSITVTSFATAADVDLTTVAVNGQPTDMFLAVDSASVVAFSFDGRLDHGRLKGDAAPLYFTHQREMKCQKIWFRVVSGTNPAVVHASLWSK